MNTTKSTVLFHEAQKHMPGGVNSPVRAFKSVGRDPLYIASAKDSKIYDVDGTEFIDYIGSWGPMILGHANERVISDQGSGGRWNEFWSELRNSQLAQKL